ncbi:MAG: EAL domain-containing protein [Planctomycetes bacterium]|nr:EAL domain-containing protein [Planctomycetota bacterium]
MTLPGREPRGCTACSPASASPLTFAVEFEPVRSVRRDAVVAHEAVARGAAGLRGGALRAALPTGALPAFEQRCRVEAIEQAVRLGIGGDLGIDFSPDTVADPERCLRGTLAALDAHGIAHERMVLEITEAEPAHDDARLLEVVSACRRLGFRIATDDFGCGHSGLNQLARLQPDWIKLDRRLVQGVHERPARQAVLRGVLTVCRELGIEPVALGVDDAGEVAWLREAGVDLFQGACADPRGG